MGRQVGGKVGRWVVGIILPGIGAILGIGAIGPWARLEPVVDAVGRLPPLLLAPHLPLIRLQRRTVQHLYVFKDGPYNIYTSSKTDRTTFIRLQNHAVLEL